LLGTGPLAAAPASASTGSPSKLADKVLTEVWDGKSWTIAPKPVAVGWSGANGWAGQATARPPHAKNSEFSGVSCLTPADCTATGAYQVEKISGDGGKPLAEHR
jgi:hypothetical protein